MTLGDILLALQAAGEIPRSEHSDRTASSIAGGPHAYTVLPSL